MKRMVFWDLDLVLLRTKDLLLRIQEDLGTAVGQSPEAIFAAILAVDETGFSWRKLFEYIHLPPALWDEAEVFCFNHYETRTRDFVAAGVLEIVQHLASLGAEQHLVTFGQETFQREKWGRLHDFHPYFESQIYVGPGGSKGDAIAQRLAAEGGVVRSAFVDDSATWLRDARTKVRATYRIRATWVTGYAPVEGDGTHWSVARTPRDALAHILST